MISVRIFFASVLFALSIASSGDLLAQSTGLGVRSSDERQSIRIVSSTNVEWRRDRSCPKISDVTFHLSVDRGRTWTLLGRGVNFGEGWMTDCAPLPSAGLIRARGLTGFGWRHEDLSYSSVDVDHTFQPPSINGNLTAYTLRPDGKLVLLVSSSVVLTTLGEKASPNKLIRLDANGSVDPTFKPSTKIGDYPSNVVAQADGKLLVVPTSINGSNDFDLVRLEPDGALDATFQYHTAPFYDIGNVTPLPDGKTLLLTHSRAFGYVQPGNTLSLTLTVPAPSPDQLIQLNSDGSTDFTHAFDIGARAGLVSLQPRGKILVVETPSVILASPGNDSTIVRLNSDGTTDAAFPTISEVDYGIGETVSLPDGAQLAIVWAGDNLISFIQRFHADFNGDSSFQGAPAGDFALQADGKIVINESSGLIHPGAEDSISRLNSNGTVDASFQTDFKNTSNGSGGRPGLAIESNGAILVFGPDSTITRVNQALSSQTLRVEHSSVVKWLRGGTAPEIESASFDLSQDRGRSWVSLGNAARIQGGWGLDGISVPPGSLLRARGMTLTPLNGGPSSEIEQYHSVPATGAH